MSDLEINYNYDPYMQERMNRLREQEHQRGIKVVKFDGDLTIDFLRVIKRIVLLNQMDASCIDRTRGYEADSTLFVLVENNYMMIKALDNINDFLLTRDYDISTYRHKYQIIINRHPHG